MNDSKPCDECDKVAERKRERERESGKKELTCGGELGDRVELFLHLLIAAGSNGLNC